MENILNLHKKMPAPAISCSNLSKLAPNKSGGKTQFYRKAVPCSSRPAHKVNPETAGLMIDQQGELFDCRGRYTAEEI